MVTEVSILGVSLYSNTITRGGKPRSGQVWGQPAGFGYRDPVEWPLWLNPNGCSSFSFANVTFSLSSVNFFLFPKTSLSWISSYLSDPSFSGMQKKRGVWRRLSVVGYCSYLLSTLSHYGNFPFHSSSITTYELVTSNSKSASFISLGSRPFCATAYWTFPPGCPVGTSNSVSETTLSSSQAKPALMYVSSQQMTPLSTWLPRLLSILSSTGPRPSWLPLT